MDSAGDVATSAISSWTCAVCARVLVSAAAPAVASATVMLLLADWPGSNK